MDVDHPLPIPQKHPKAEELKESKKGPAGDDDESMTSEKPAGTAERDEVVKPNETVVREAEVVKENGPVESEAEVAKEDGKVETVASTVETGTTQSQLPPPPAAPQSQPEEVENTQTQTNAMQPPQPQQTETKTEDAETETPPLQPTQPEAEVATESTRPTILKGQPVAHKRSKPEMNKSDVKIGSSGDPTNQSEGAPPATKRQTVEGKPEGN